MYDGSHTILFTDGSTAVNRTTGMTELIGANTWDTWHLIPTKRPSVAPPEPVIKKVQIPGRNGQLDFSTYLTGKTVYGERTGSWEFVVDNDHEDWTTIRDKMAEYLHGKRMSCVLNDDPNYLYTGRFTVSNWDSGANNSRISISYVLYPYKVNWRAADMASANWLWDPFNFEMDTIGQADTSRI